MITHAERFSQSQRRLASYARALAHPARIAILRHLAKADICDCAQIVVDLPLAQSTVSQHLKVLKDAGLIKMCTDGPRSCYSLNQDAFAEHSDFILGFLESLTDSCGCGAEFDLGETMKKSGILKFIVKQNNGRTAQHTTGATESPCCGGKSDCKNDDSTAAT